MDTTQKILVGVVTISLGGLAAAYMLKHWGPKKEPAPPPLPNVPKLPLQEAKGRKRDRAGSFMV